MKILHLAAPETFAIDGYPACKKRRGFGSETDSDFNVTHTVADVTCKSCQRTLEYKRAVSLGLKENDETWES